MIFQLEIPDDKLRQIAQAEVTACFESRAYNPPAGIASLRRQVRECIDGLDVRDTVRTLVLEFAEAAARDEVRAALRKLAREVVKEEIEKGSPLFKSA